MTEGIKVGDVVRLKSDNEKMIVTEINGDEVSVLWRSQGIDNRRTYPLSALVKWDEGGYEPPQLDSILTMRSRGLGR